VAALMKSGDLRGLEAVFDEILEEERVEDMIDEGMAAAGIVAHLAGFKGRVETLTLCPDAYAEYVRKFREHALPAQWFVAKAFAATKAVIAEPFADRWFKV